MNIIRWENQSIMKDSTDMIHKKIDTVHVEPSHKIALSPPQRIKKRKTGKKKENRRSSKNWFLGPKIKATWEGKQEIVIPNLLPPHPNLSMSNMNNRTSKTGKCQFPCQSETKEWEQQPAT